MNAKPNYVSVPRLWPNSTVVCLASGPSLTQADVDRCRGQRVIAVNDTWTLAPWADCLFAADQSWWRKNQGVPAFAGLKYSIEPQAIAWPGLKVLQNTGPHGLELNPTGLRTGHNSGFQSLGLAFHLGAKRIILLGFDLKGGHFYAAKPEGRGFPGWLKAFQTIVAPLKAAGVEVLNCTSSSALQCFPMGNLQDELSRLERVA